MEQKRFRKKAYLIFWELTMRSWTVAVEPMMSVMVREQCTGSPVLNLAIGGCLPAVSRLPLAAGAGFTSSS